MKVPYLSSHLQVITQHVLHRSGVERMDGKMTWKERPISGGTDLRPELRKELHPVLSQAPSNFTRTAAIIFKYQHWQFTQPGSPPF